MTTQLPEPWEHKRGYRLNADGKSIKYEHSETGRGLVVEAILDVDQHYAVWQLNSSGDVEEIPELFDTKGGAFDRARELAE